VGGISSTRTSFQNGTHAGGKKKKQQKKKKASGGGGGEKRWGGVKGKTGCKQWPKHEGWGKRIPKCIQRSLGGDLVDKKLKHARTGDDG